MSCCLTYFSNYPAFLIDTAGIRETNDKIEGIGIEKTKQEIISADIVYNIQSREKTNHKTDENKTIMIYNKSDLMEKNEILELQTKKPNHLIVSAKEKSGLNKLRSRTEKLLKLKTKSSDSLFLNSSTASLRATTSLKFPAF